jgi:ribonuclease Z
VDLTVTFLGTSASVPTAARGVAATLIARGGERLLVDCGEGTQRQLLRSGLGLVDLDAVLITHLHGDHYLGLPGLLKTYALRGRERPLLIIGPEGLERLVEALRIVFGRLTFDVDLLETDPGEVLRLEHARVDGFPTDHGVPSLGYALLEDDRPGQFDVEAARGLGVPEGPLFGRLQRGEAIVLGDGREVRPDDVLGPPRVGRRLVLTGDTRPCLSTEAAARGAQLLVHEATFADEDHQRAVETRHSTVGEACDVALAAGVGMLALTHLSSRMSPRQTRLAARARVPGAVVPRDFDRVEIPFVERGPAVLVPAPRGGGEASAPSGDGAGEALDDH